MSDTSGVVDYCVSNPTLFTLRLLYISHNEPIRVRLTSQLTLSQDIGVYQQIPPTVPGGNLARKALTLASAVSSNYLYAKSVIFEAIGNFSAYMFLLRALVTSLILGIPFRN